MDLTADEARRLILRAQGFLGAGGRKGGPSGMLRRLGAVQLDTISVLARSHELVAYARLGAIGRPAVEQAYWSGSAFEYWCHAACILPIEHWPVYAFRRRAYRERRFRWHEVPATVGDILERVRRDGPLTTGDIGGAKKGGPWWDWSDAKISIEFLLDVGDVVCVRREGWRRVYDLAERAIPAEHREIDLTDEECVTRLTSIAGRSLAVATRADLVDYTRVRDKHAAMLDDALLSGASGLVPVTVAGWPAARRGGPNAWADPEALALGEARGRHRTTLLSPFDSLIWERARAERVFGMAHRLEAYVPKEKRVHGYFAMPVLHGGKLIARVDPAREGTTLVARRVTLEPGVKKLDAVEEALREAATWVGCTGLRIEEIR
ncbi:winged helix-turn-helix domain-containing protein [Herbidospora sp. NEAU-GS84]|uniref:Winged helix-turn-helix domain-containing protein n=1 Tax=Herbidospora solisilvae TaxID=2696284 RepID=A0A7C9J5J7_9ACTN|nr:crosslink repair DNA glycosylase YcaQ family protein [Herbidospora solisilvae]NAS24420.1 winged helix-turn-helix domain-containing protein [Herbidospora solisilvae]